MVSKEYALERLDRWYSDRLETHYTEEVGEKYRERILDQIKRERLHGLESRISSPEILQKFSRESQLKEGSIMFTEMYSSIEKFLEGYEIEGMKIGDIPKKYYDFIIPALEDISKFQKFVNRVREVAAKNPLREVEDGEIEKSLVEEFGGRRGFTKFCQKFSVSAVYLMEILVEEGEVLREDLDFGYQFMRVTSDQLPWLHKKLFADL